MDELNPKQINEYIDKYALILEKQARHRAFVAELELDVEKNKTKLLQLSNLLSELHEKEEIYEENRESIEDFENLLKKKVIFEAELEGLSKSYEDMKQGVLNLYKRRILSFWSNRPPSAICS